MPDGTEISCAVVIGNTKSFYGFRRTSGTITFIDNRDSLFEIGSVTKVFTSLIFASMTASNSISPNDTVESSLRGIVSDLSPVCGEVTLLELSNHTSGLPKVPNKILRTYSNDNPYINFTNSDMTEYLSCEIETLFKPGEAYSYSNTGAGLLGFILEKKSGLTFEELLTKFVLVPYRLTHSGINHPGSGIILVQGLDRTGDVVSPWYFDSMKGAGAMYSSASDLASFISAQFSNDVILELQRKPTFTASDKMSLAMGWHILHEKNRMFYCHTGGTGGYTATIIIDPAEAKGVTILSNVSGLSPKASDISLASRQIIHSLINNK